MRATAIEARDRARAGRGRRRGDRARAAPAWPISRATSSAQAASRCSTASPARSSLAESLVAARPQDIEAQHLCPAARQALCGRIRALLACAGNS